MLQHDMSESQCQDVRHTTRSAYMLYKCVESHEVKQAVPFAVQSADSNRQDKPNGLC